MAEFPALPFFTDAYLGDTRHLSTLQHGAYCLMLMTAWRDSDCSLPDDDILLSRITGLDRRTWLKNKPVLLAFWQLNGELKWIQKRLLDERIYVEQLRNKNSTAGKASALKRKNRGSTTVQPKRNEKSTPILTLTPIEEETKASSSATPCKMPFTSILPEWKALAMKDKGWSEEVTLDIWQNFYEYWRNGKGRNVKREDWLTSWKTWYRRENIKPSKESHYENAQRPNAYPSKPSFKSEGKRLADKYREDAEREEQAAVSGTAEPNLRIAEGVREDAG